MDLLEQLNFDKEYWYSTLIVCFIFLLINLIWSIIVYFYSDEEYNNCENKVVFDFIINLSIIVMNLF